MRSSRATRRARIDLQVAVQLAVVARFFERIGDHAVNIAERVRFLVEGSASSVDDERQAHPSSGE